MPDARPHPCQGGRARAGHRRTCGARRHGSGATPTETLLASLFGCTNVILNRVAEHAGVKIQRLSVAADATCDRRGVTLQEDIAVPFPDVTLTINVTTGASDAALAKVKADLGKFCPVSKVIRQSGTKLTEIWNVSRP